MKEKSDTMQKKKQEENSEVITDIDLQLSPLNLKDFLGKDYEEWLDEIKLTFPLMEEE
jgi:hypothetical protein